MMMTTFPFGMPTFRKRYPQYTPPPPKFSSNVLYSGYQAPKGNLQNKEFSNNDVKNNLECNSNFSNNIFQDNEQYFEIFGLKLHFDDLLIIAILFFLYQEEVKDTYLYIALILLLLS